MAKIYFWSGLGAAGVFAIITIAFTKAQGNQNIWYHWIIDSAWVLPVLALFSAICFLLALREWKQFRRYAWLVFGWIIPPRYSADELPQRERADEADLLRFIEQTGRDLREERVTALTRKGLLFHPSLSEAGNRRIEGALYGSSTREPDVIPWEKLMSLSQKDREIHVDHHTLCDKGHDPHPGEDLKFLTVTFSETLRQGDMLRLPLEWLKGVDKVGGSPSLKRTEAPPTDPLEAAPRPLITYEAAGVPIEGTQGGWAELFDIYNDGPTTAAGIWFGALTWVEQRPFTLCRAIPQVPTKNHVIAHLALNAENGQQLGDFLRQRPGLKPTVTIAFQDLNENRFCCDYELCVEAGGRLLWNPRQVRRLGAGAQI